MDKKITILIFYLIFPVVLIAQVQISGTITDENKIAMPGVNIIVQGTLNGTITDLSGNYSIGANPEDTIVYSMIGMVNQKFLVGNNTTINVTLVTERQTIDEVVVIGYGTQRVKDMTAPVINISGEELSKQVTSGAMQALQGKAAGVQIVNSGIPGRGPSVKIRGLGSIGDYANPLFVVDGVFVDNLDFISTSDIEDITILKDASAAAIYGVRAANGVILVTTKKGGSGLPVISYDGYYGIQVPVNIMKLATKDQYFELLNEANVNTTGYIPRDPANYTANTDWYSELVRTAPMTGHSLDISGSNEKTNYSFGGSFLFQDGIMDIKNYYNRFNIRARLDQEVNKYLKIGINILNSRFDRYNPNDGAFFQAFVNPPIYSVYDPGNVEAYPVPFGSAQKFGLGNSYGNPVAAAYYNDNYEKGNRLVFSAYSEIYIIKDKLTFKTSYNQDFGNGTKRNYIPAFNVGGSQSVRKSSLTKDADNSSRQIIDNLLTYSNSNDGKLFSILLGQSTRIEKTEFLSGSAVDVPDIDDQSKYLVTGSFRDRNSNDGANRYNGLSFFTRATYSYNSKYLATLTFRADGSSKYQKKWGYFPSVGLGWTISEEDFMSGNLFDYLKIRASWGLLGNDNVPANSAVTLGQTGIGSSAVFGDNLVDGVGSQTVLQNFLEWEVVSEFNLGSDFTFSNNKLSGDIELYHRTTNNVVFFAPIATGGGKADLLANNGKVLNAGVELMLNWKDKISDNTNYNISFNVSGVYNEVLELAGKDFIPGGPVRGNFNFSTRTAVGHPIGSFYGYEIAGVYESESQALLDDHNQVIKNKGFFKYKDQNGDKVIDDKDKVYLGSSLPKLFAGLDYRLNVRKFDVSISIYGQLGNKILNAKRMNRDVFADGNYDSDFYENRWTEDNKSDKYPSAEAYNFSFIQQANDFFVENGSFVRIQNIQAGYTTGGVKFIQKLRFYISAQRPYTFFTYNGFSPEVSGEPLNGGIDTSVHPLQAIYTIGFKANF